MKSKALDKLLFAGFQETGKTTFIVALWHVIESGELPQSLRLENLSEVDRKYIVARHSEWCSFEEMKRTEYSSPEEITLSLVDPETNQKLKVIIPDLSGETFKYHFEDRRWERSFWESVQNVDCLMLFVNPEKLDEPTMIADANELIKAIEGSDIEKKQKPLANNKENGKSKDDLSKNREATWQTKHCCYPVKLVSMLQSLSDNIPSKPLRVALIVSALDVLDHIPSFKNKPVEFIKHKLSYVEQYLVSNPERFEWKVFGVSAQGANYDDKGIEELSNFTNPSERIRVVNDGQAHHDITAPIRWLMLNKQGEDTIE